MIRAVISGELRSRDPDVPASNEKQCNDSLKRSLSAFSKPWSERFNHRLQLVLAQVGSESVHFAVALQRLEHLLTKALPCYVVL